MNTLAHNTWTEGWATIGKDIRRPAIRGRRAVSKLLAPVSVNLDKRWGLDHCTWSVLCHVFPEADVSIIQLSIDEMQSAEFHYVTAKAANRLARRIRGGSGNLVHNLHAYGWGRRQIKPFDWAVRFEGRARELLLAGYHDPTHRI